eukprot:scaffold177526_cov32-Tisochrysis_lutea.AAC.4
MEICASRWHKSSKSCMQARGMIPRSSGSALWRLSVLITASGPIMVWVLPEPVWPYAMIVAE